MKKLRIRVISSDINKTELVRSSLNDSSRQIEIIQTISKEPSKIDLNDADLLIFDEKNYIKSGHLSDSKNNIPVIVVTKNQNISIPGDLTECLADDELKSPVLKYTIHHLLKEKEIISKNEKLQHLVVKDDLTGLYNKRFGIDLLNLELNKSKRYDQDASALLIGIDGMKNINSHYGYSDGNDLLCEFSILTQHAVREVDSVMRFNGDEFLVILPSTDQSEAIMAAKRIQNSISKHTFLNGRLSYSLTVSIGVAGINKDYDSATDWIEELREALSEAKLSGRNQLATPEKAALSKNNTLKENTEIIGEIYQSIKNVNETLMNTYLNEILKILDNNPFYKKFIAPHAERVAFYADKLAMKAGLSSEDIATIKRAGLFHDIGKVAIDKAILLKNKSLAGSEYDLIKKHPSIACRMMEALLWEDEKKYILHHHEWFNGTGYPEGRKKEGIPIGSRILSLAEAWDTMTTDQFYRPALSLDKAINQIKCNQGNQFDPELSQIFVEMIEG